MQKGLTQTQLAEAVGVTQGAVNQWESGLTYPRTSKLLVISEILGCKPDLLISEAEKREKERKAG